MERMTRRSVTTKRTIRPMRPGSVSSRISSKRPVFHSAMKSRRMASSLKISPALLVMSAFKVSCGTRRAPRNSMASMASPASGLAASTGLGASSCGCRAGCCWAGCCGGGCGGAPPDRGHILKRIVLGLRRSAGRRLLRFLLGRRRWLRRLRLRAERMDPESAETGRCYHQANTPETLHASIPFHSA